MELLIGYLIVGCALFISSLYDIDDGDVDIIHNAFNIPYKFTILVRGVLYLNAFVMSFLWFYYAPKQVIINRLSKHEK